jgi:membrane-bound lytic murein transglycosylase A
MQRIKDWMKVNPNKAAEVRATNRSFVFFRITGLDKDDEPVGAQNVPLMPGRSIAVDKTHVYGTPIYIEATLPIDSPRPVTPFRRLMIAQDTGSAIVGPARADLYFGAGAEAGKISGRFRHNARFVILVPKSLDPLARGRKMPVPDERPSEKIAKLFPQVDPLKDPSRDQPRDQKNTAPAAAPAAAAAPSSTTSAAIVKPVPLPEARPKIAPSGDARRLNVRHQQLRRRGP